MGHGRVGCAIGQHNPVLPPAPAAPHPPAPSPRRARPACGGMMHACMCTCVSLPCAQINQHHVKDEEEPKLIPAFVKASGNDDGYLRDLGRRCVG